MKRIRIFLASSITDLKFDRIEIGNFFRQLNDIYIESGIYFDLVMCEDYDNGIALEGKQSELDALLRDSEIVFFVFFNKVGDYTYHEFEVALESYKSSSKPKIVTYFKYVNTVEEATQDVKSFMNMLDTELRHYYNIYSEIDTLKLGMFMQIKLMRLDNSKITVEDGKLMNGKTMIAETKNIPMFECNEKLKELRKKLDEAEKKYKSAKVAFLKSNSDDDYLAFSDAASEKEKAEKSLREIESAVLSAAEKIYETAADGTILSEKQKQAYRHIEKGEWDLALAILDKNEIISELSHNQRLGDIIIDRIAANVGELLLRVEVLRAAGLDKESIEEILSLYNTVYDVTVKHNLDLKPIAKYASFLHDDISRSHEAKKIADKLSYLYEDPDRNISLEDRAELLFLRGKIYSGLKQHDKTIELLKEGIQIADELYEKEGPRVAVICGGIRNVSANAHYYLKQYNESFSRHKEAMKYYEIAYSYDSKTNKHWLGMIYDNYACDLENFDEKDKYEEALEYHKKAIKLYQEAAADNSKYKKALSRCYHNTALCYDKIKDFDNCEKYLLESINIREEIALSNPAAVEKLLSGSYISLGLLYLYDKPDSQKALDAINKSKKLRISLRKRSNIYADEMRDAFTSIIYNKNSIFSPEQVREFRKEYVDLLISLPDLTEKERRDLCEEGSFLAEDLFDFDDYENTLKYILVSLDIYIKEGNADWYVSIHYQMYMLQQICERFDKKEIFADYSKRLEEKN